MTLGKKELKRFCRYRGYDYSRGAVLFITIVTNPRRRLFGRIINAKLVKTPLGEEVERSLAYEAAHTSGLRLYERVVMPDHVHFRVYLEKGLDEPLKVLGGFVRRFKTWTTRYWKLQAGLATQDGGSGDLRQAGPATQGEGKLQAGLATQDGGNDALRQAGLAIQGEGKLQAGLATQDGGSVALRQAGLAIQGEGKLQAGLATQDGGSGALGQAGLATQGEGSLLDSRAPLGGLWQQGYHDWLCVSEEMIAAVARYIVYNPLKFELRYNQPEFLAIREPLAAWRLSPEEFWRGIGATDLLDGETPFISLRISRKLSARQISEAVSRIRRRIGDYVFVGGWISAGEKAVRDMLLNEPQGKIVQILPSAMPHDYRPGSVWLPAIRDKRAAIVARGNSEIEFSRAACLEVNDEAKKIAMIGCEAQATLSGQGQGGAMGACRDKAIYWLPEGPTLL